MNYKDFENNIFQNTDTLTITSFFGKRDDPNSKGVKMHNGVDIRCNVGTPILAPYSGVVAASRIDTKGAGLWLAIKVEFTGGNLYVLFMHLSKLAPNIGIGRRVRAGDIIAYSGGTRGDKNAGSSTGPHLHLEIRTGTNYSANAVDPLFYFIARFKIIDAATNEVIRNGKISRKQIFSDSEVKRQSEYVYSKVQRSDSTIKSETEYPPAKSSPIKRNNTVDERLAMGIWRITKLIMDSSVEKRQVADSSISVQTGSLLNFFQKVCQRPLVEFFGDTYGNQYYWIVRKPPFDKESIDRMLELTTLNIEAEDVIQTSLSWNDEDVFSWYKIMPYMEFQGDNEATNILYPAVFFPEYASVWGSRPLCLESNYYDFRFSGLKNDDKKLNNQNIKDISKNCIRDLKFLIESNAYLPFTRKGTIVLKGDRRIKRGNYILHTSGEIFYVDAVMNDYSVTFGSVQRTTTLTVSRGMYPDFIQGQEYVDDRGNLRTISYFSLIDWGEGFDIEKITFQNHRDFMNKWKVDNNVFGFFMSKRQVFDQQIKKNNNKTKEDDQWEI